MYVRFCLCFCFCLSLLLAVEEEDNSTPIEQHSNQTLSFIPGTGSLYIYTTTMTTEQHTLNDKLTFTTQMEWKLFCEVVSQDNETTHLRMTWYDIAAHHKGPGSQHTYDSTITEKQDDPLLGHFAAFHGIAIDLTWNHASQSITAVSGGKKLIAAINARKPGAFGEAGPLNTPATHLYNNEALTQLWKNIIFIPRVAAEEITLRTPVTGSLNRTWNGNTYTLTLPADQNSLPVILHKAPAEVSGEITHVNGSGLVHIENGKLKKTEGNLTMHISLTALTQALTQVNTIRWSFVHVEDLKE